MLTFTVPCHRSVENIIFVIIFFFIFFTWLEGNWRTAWATVKNAIITMICTLCCWDHHACNFLWSFLLLVETKDIVEVLKLSTFHTIALEQLCMLMFAKLEITFLCRKGDSYRARCHSNCRLSIKQEFTELLCIKLEGTKVVGQSSIPDRIRVEMANKWISPEGIYHEADVLPSQCTFSFCIFWDIYFLRNLRDKHCHE